MKDIKFSVIMPAYNVQDSIEESINSVFPSTVTALVSAAMRSLTP